MKVPEKFGFNWSIFGWFGHFTEHVVGEILGFRRNGHMRSENPPEGAKNLQGYTIGTIEHISPTGYMGFHRYLKDLQKGEKGGAPLSVRQRTAEKGRGEAAHRGGRGGESTVTGARWPEMVTAGGRRSPAEKEIARTESWAAGRQRASGSARAGGCFLKREMGTPDSLQCLSGAHRTAHRKRDF